MGEVICKWIEGGKHQDKKRIVYLAPTERGGGGCRKTRRGMCQQRQERRNLNVTHTHKYTHARPDGQAGQRTKPRFDTPTNA